jgi:hypothetical protein
MPVESVKPRALSSNTIDLPQAPPSETALSPLGTVGVSGTVATAPAEIRAQVFRTTDTIPANPPATAVLCTLVGNTYSYAEVGGARGALGTADQNNVMVVWFKRPDSTWEIADKIFAGKSANSFTQVVKATQAVWFAWAPADFLGPFGEAGTDYVPAGLAVPTDAAGLTISAQGSWRHDPSYTEASGPDGLNGYGGIPNEPSGLGDPRYQDAQYQSAGIDTLTTFLNQLLGIWELNDGPPAATAARPQLPIGGNFFTSNIPTGATRFFLMFHDGFQWNNNSGTVTAAVSWND